MTAMKSAAFGMLALAMAGLAGCATVEITSDGKLQRHDRLLVINGEGYELVGLVPLGSSRLEWDESVNDVDRMPMAFENHADSQHVYELARRIALRDNCELVNLTIIDNYSASDPNRCWGLITCDDVTLSAILRKR